MLSISLIHVWIFYKNCVKYTYSFPQYQYYLHSLTSHQHFFSPPPCLWTSVPASCPCFLLPASCSCFLLPVPASCSCFLSQGFLEKNRDALSADLIQLVDTSSNKLLKQAFKNELTSGTIINTTNPKLMITPKNSLRVRQSVILAPVLGCSGELVTGIFI